MTKEIGKETTHIATSLPDAVPYIELDIYKTV